MGLYKGEHCDLTLHTREKSQPRGKGKKLVFATSDNFMALDICIYVYVHGLFPVHLSAKTDPQSLSSST